MKQLFLAILFGLIFLVHPTYSFAQDQNPFRSTISTTYRVDDVGNTAVTHELKVTNRTPTTFIKQYALRASSTDIHGVTVTYENKSLTPVIAATPKGTSVAIDFPDDVVGENKTRTFTISYTTAELATIGGRVLEVHIPRMSGEASFDDQAVVIQTPAKFGKPVRTNPSPDSTNDDASTITSKFLHSDGRAISLLFGETQIYNATIRYHLENPGSAEALGQIALPPDTSFQRVQYQSLEPLPSSLKRDDDGNWIATYRLLGNSTVTVHLHANIEVTLQKNDTPVQPTLPAHTQGQEYWQVGSSTIKNLAQEHSTPESIYTYVTQSLSYTNDVPSRRQHRLGAIEALAQPDQAVCQEFTDSFIAIARAAGIPARRLTGYAYTQNETLRPLSLEGDVLHAWPEYFDSGAGVWRPIDPTWGDTTNGVDYFHQFDLNHIVFAINGVSSTTPYAAGFYKTQEFNSKDIEITFGAVQPVLPASFVVSTTPQTMIGLPIPGIEQVSVINETGRAYYDIDLRISSGAEIDSTKHIDAILPFEHVTFSIPTFTKSWHLPRSMRATATILDAHQTQLYEKSDLSITSAPPIFGQLRNPAIIVSVGIGAIFATLAAGSVLVFRRKQQRFVRRKS